MARLSPALWGHGAHLREAWFLLSGSGVLAAVVRAGNTAVCSSQCWCLHLQGLLGEGFAIRSPRGHKNTKKKESVCTYMYRNISYGIWSYC